MILTVGFGLVASKPDEKKVLSESVASPSPSHSPTNFETQGSTQSAGKSGLYSIVSVVDGDTVKVSIDGKTKTIRLIGIDSPETVDPRKPVQCFGKQASAEAKSTLMDKKVRLESDPTQGDKDKYDRLLRYVFLEDGTNFNQEMISKGFAHEYTYDLPYKYQSLFKSSEKSAMQKDLGLWSPQTCNGTTTNTTGTNTSVLKTSTNSASYQEIHEVIKTDNATTEIIQQTSTSQGQSISGSD